MFLAPFSLDYSKSTAFGCKNNLQDLPSNLEQFSSGCMGKDAAMVKTAGASLMFHSYLVKSLFSYVLLALAYAICCRSSAWKNISG